MDLIEWRSSGWTGCVGKPMRKGSPRRLDLRGCVNWMTWMENGPILSCKDAIAGLWIGWVDRLIRCTRSWNWKTRWSGIWRVDVRLWRQGFLPLERSSQEISFVFDFSPWSKFDPPMFVLHPEPTTTCYSINKIDFISLRTDHRRAESWSCPGAASSLTKYRRRCFWCVVDAVVMPTFPAERSEHRHMNQKCSRHQVIFILSSSRPPSLRDFKATVSFPLIIPPKYQSFSSKMLLVSAVLLRVCWDVCVVRAVGFG